VIASISDRIQECGADAANHRRFVACIARLVKGLRREGVIARQQKGALQRCSGKIASPWTA